jgi:hypothetical protein
MATLTNWAKILAAIAPAATTAVKTLVGTGAANTVTPITTGAAGATSTGATGAAGSGAVTQTAQKAAATPAGSVTTSYGVTYNPNTDYMALMQQAAAQGQYATAAAYERQRNAKLSDLGRGNEVTSRYYDSSGIGGTYTTSQNVDPATAVYGGTNQYYPVVSAGDVAGWNASAGAATAQQAQKLAEAAQTPEAIQAAYAASTPLNSSLGYQEALELAQKASATYGSGLTGTSGAAGTSGATGTAPFLTVDKNGNAVTGGTIGGNDAKLAFLDPLREATRYGSSEGAAVVNKIVSDYSQALNAYDTAALEYQRAQAAGDTAAMQRAQAAMTAARQSSYSIAQNSGGLITDPGYANGSGRSVNVGTFLYKYGSNDNTTSSSNVSSSANASNVNNTAYQDYLASSSSPTVTKYSYEPQPTWADQYAPMYNNQLNEVVNRQDFSYDPATDPNTQWYAQQYLMEGDRATENAIAQAAALSGGMPSSAAVTAGTQAGDYYAAQLTAKYPELYQQAYDRYVSEFNMDRAALGDVYDARNFDYGVYRGDVSDYQANRSFDYTDYLNQYEMARQAEQTAYDRAIYADETAYSRARDTLSDTRYDTEYADLMEQQNYENMTAAQKEAFNRAWSMFEVGIINDEVASALGYATTAQLQSAYNALVASKATSSGSGSGSGSGSDLDGLDGEYYVEDYGIVPTVLSPSDTRFLAGEQGMAQLKNTYGSTYMAAWNAVGKVAVDGGSQALAEEALANYVGALTTNELAGILVSFGYSYK